jgi:hypothetical protein
MDDLNSAPAAGAADTSTIPSTLVGDGGAALDDTALGTTGDAGTTEPIVPAQGEEGTGEGQQPTADDGKPGQQPETDAQPPQQTAATQPGRKPSPVEVLAPLRNDPKYGPAIQSITDSLTNFQSIYRTPGEAWGVAQYFKTPQTAKTYFENGNAFLAEKTKLAQGDYKGVLETYVKNDPQGTAKFLESVMPVARELAPEVAAKIADELISDRLDEWLEIANRNPEKFKEESAAITKMIQSAFGRQPGQGKPQPSPREIELQKRLEEQDKANRTADEQAWGEASTRAGNKALELLRAQVEKDLKSVFAKANASDYEKKNRLDEVMNSLLKALHDSPALRPQIASMRAEAKGKYQNIEKEVTDLLFLHGMQARGDLVKAAIKSWHDMTMAEQAERQRKQKAAASRTDISGTAPGRNRAKRPEPKDIDYRNLSDRDILNMEFEG